MPPATEVAVSEVEGILNYTFSNKLLLVHALTHRSYDASANYQRLEFLGDVVIGLAITNYFFLTQPELEEGKLNDLRSANVRTEKLARVAVQHKLYLYLRQQIDNYGGEVRQFEAAVSDEDVTAIHSGSIKARKFLADVVKSLAGAVYFDVNFNLEKFWVIFRGLLEPIITPEALQLQPQAMKMLHDECQRKGRHLDIIQCVDGEKIIVSIFVDGCFVTSGSSTHSLLAKLNAAKLALHKLSHSMSITIEKSNIFGTRSCNRATSTAPTSSDMKLAISEVERIIKYNFRNKLLLEEALTHNSYIGFPSYERLEFLGDAVLALAFSTHLYLAYPDRDPGQLSQLCAVNLSTEKLARIAIKQELYHHLRGAVSASKLKEFAALVNSEHTVVIHGESMKAPKTLADMVEALAGAIYVDVDFDLEKLWVIFRGLLEPVITFEDLEQQQQPITMLFNLCSKQGKKLDMIEWENGEKRITTVFVDGQFIISGSSRKEKKTAKLNAARGAMHKLLQLMSDSTDIHMNDSNHGIDDPLKKWSMPTLQH